MSKEKVNLPAVPQRALRIPSAPERPSYLAAALKNKINLGVIAGAIAFSVLIANPIPVLAVAVVELVYLGIVPGMARFRRIVDANHRGKLLAHSRSVDAEIYRTLLPKQQATVDALKAIRDNIFSNYKRIGAGFSGSVAPSFERIDKLLSSFVRMLDQLNTYRNYLGTNDKGRLDMDLRDIRSEIEKEENPRIKEIKERRLEILEQRITRFDRAQENREVITHQLAAIEDTIRLIHEQSLTARDPQDINRLIETISVEVEVAEATMQEMEGFLRVHSELDDLRPLPPQRV